jgi:ABC-type lipoprotein export system ATPase subunit
MILVTHDKSIAEYADKVVTIEDGNIIMTHERGEVEGNEAEI